MSVRASAKASRFTESVIREMTRLANLHGAVNLSQGFPDFAAPEEIKEAARRAIAADVNQYAITWGARSLREAIAAKFQRLYGLPVDPERELTVTCGSTEAMIAALLAVLDPGDEVVVFEPFYENYGPDAILSGAVPRFVKLRPPDWSFDPAELASAFGSRTRAIIINTPNNPTGKVFTRAELLTIADQCLRHDVVAVTDEIYEHILYDGADHVPMATLPGMAERTVTINGMSKTYSVTGWRVGWAIAAPVLTDAIRKVHDFLTVGAAAPLQEAGAVALAMPASYYSALAEAYARRRERLLGILGKAGFRLYRPRGAYYIMTQIEGLGWDDDVAFARHLVQEVGVAVVPGSSFYNDPADGRRQVRFAFCKKDATLDEAERRLARLAPRSRR
jgi:aspartate/methionine/tyrosine aminotransferase